MLTQLREPFLDWELYTRANPDLLKTGLPNTLILTVSASVIGLLLAVSGMSRSRWLRSPALVNQFISLLKASSLVYFLGLVASQRELLQVGRDLNAQTGNLSPLVAAGLFYLMLTIPLTHLVNDIDTRRRRGKKADPDEPLDPATTSQEMV